ncbi:MAG: histidine phosphatase family protein [Sphingomonas sp.]|uniref:SixA phosphatase family protein n=1 Tax=Sphingomonas sp. TaxID=28214 RepID=UPI0025D6492D|nr:histidine phosphatase family protein [Sphingomonas sp.]MBX9880587.1 histidine phosphatase family protein [Sphingomonas sp.]
MKHLFLLRHAKSGYSDDIPRDFDRPLNARGERAAETIGRYCRRERLAFDAAIASDAVRCVQTVAGVESGLGAALGVQWQRGLYLASAATLLEAVQALPGAASHALLVGHNPGLEDLIFDLVPEGDPLRDQVYEKFPTAALAELVAEGGWSDFGAAAAPGAVRLTRFVRPRDLDPSLGPDGD